MIAVEIMELNNEVIDIDSIQEFEDIGKVVDMELNMCHQSLMYFEKAFGNSKYNEEANKAQYVAFQTYHKVLSAIKENQVLTGSYLFTQKPSKTLLKNIKKLKQQFQLVLELFGDISISEGFLLIAADVYKKHYQMLEFLTDVLDIC